MPKLPGTAFQTDDGDRDYENDPYETDSSMASPLDYEPPMLRVPQRKSSEAPEQASALSDYAAQVDEDDETPPWERNAPADAPR